MRDFPENSNLRLLLPPLQNYLKRNGTLLFVLCLLTASCASPPLNMKDTSDPRKIEKRIRDEYAQWEGTQHRLGGTDQNGIDCSAFVREVYRTVFNMELPRTTKGQVKEGSPVNRKDLQAGDLVFFKPPTSPRHVGIFLSGNEFVHASKSEGVIISKLDPVYWGKYYWTARRILTSAHP